MAKLPPNPLVTEVFQKVSNKKRKDCYPAGVQKSCSRSSFRLEL
jgi:hypothetical protein